MSLAGRFQLISYTALLSNSFPDTSTHLQHISSVCIIIMQFSSLVATIAFLATATAAPVTPVKPGMDMAVSYGGAWSVALIDTILTRLFRNCLKNGIIVRRPNASTRRNVLTRVATMGAMADSAMRISRASLASAGVGARSGEAHSSEQATTEDQ